MLNDNIIDSILYNNRYFRFIPFSALKLLVGDRKGIRPVKKAGCWFVGGDDLTGALHDLQLQLSPPLLSSFALINTG